MERVLKKKRKKRLSLSRLKKILDSIKMVILDVDGVLTDGSIILDNEGNEFKRFNVRDGHGIKMLHKAGIRVAIITGRKSKVVLRRADELGIEDIYQGCHNKVHAYQQILAKYNLRDEEVCYIGDDVVDIPLLKRVGFSVVPRDADPVTCSYALYITKNNGGRGAVREICDMIIYTRFKDDERTLKMILGIKEGEDPCAEK